MFINKNQWIFINVYYSITNISAMFGCNFMVTKSLIYKWNMLAICKHKNIIVFCQNWKMKAFTGGQMVRNQSCIYAKILYYTKLYSRICIGKNLYLISEYSILIKIHWLKINIYCYVYINWSPLLLKMCLLKTELVCKCLCKKKDYYLPRKEYNISAWHTRKFYVPKAHSYPINSFFSSNPYYP